MSGMIYLFLALTATALTAGWLSYEFGELVAGRVLLGSTMCGVAAIFTILLSAEMREDKMYETARLQGLSVVADPNSNTAVVISPCVFRVDYIPAADTFVFVGTSTPVLRADAEEFCKRQG